MKRVRNYHARNANVSQGPNTVDPNKNSYLNLDLPGNQYERTVSNEKIKKAALDIDNFLSGNFNDCMSEKKQD